MSDYMDIQEIECIERACEAKQPTFNHTVMRLCKQAKRVPALLSELCGRARPYTASQVNSKPIPKMDFVVRLYGKGYLITGFDSVHHWAMLNDPAWRACVTECQRSGIQEDDQRKILLSLLLRQKHGQFDATASDTTQAVPR